jgi:hypothetical protein
MVINTLLGSKHTSVEQTLQLYPIGSSFSHSMHRAISFRQICVEVVLKSFLAAFSAKGTRIVHSPGRFIQIDSAQMPKNKGGLRCLTKFS